MSYLSHEHSHALITLYWSDKHWRCNLNVFPWMMSLHRWNRSYHIERYELNIFTLGLLWSVTPWDIKVTSAGFPEGGPQNDCHDFVSWAKVSFALIIWLPFELRPNGPVTQNSGHISVEGSFDPGFLRSNFVHLYC